MEERFALFEEAGYSKWATVTLCYSQGVAQVALERFIIVCKAIALFGGRTLGRTCSGVG